MTVRWMDKHGRWQFGRLVKVVGSVAHISQGTHMRRVNADDVQPWPPSEVSNGD